MEMNHAYLQPCRQLPKLGETGRKLDVLSAQSDWNFFVKDKYYDLYNKKSKHLSM